MPRKKKQKLVHFDIDSLSKQTEHKNVNQVNSLGETLRIKREKKKLSIEDVARKLCIKEVYLQALEDGHYYAFPSHVYGIGFLRTYSKFLGLDSDLMVAEFHAETSNIKEAPMDMPVIEKHYALPSKKVLTFFALFILVLIVFWFIISSLLATDVFSKVSVSPIIDTPKQEETLSVETAPIIIDTMQSIEPEQPATTIKEQVSSVKEIKPEALQAKVAFIANADVWVRLYNTETKKAILDKVMSKNDSFIPESDLAVLQISTGRSKSVSLYMNGEKIKTFGEEKSRPLSEFISATQN